MISIKKNDKPNLEPPILICDKPLHRKLDKYDVTKFLNMHSTNLLIGKPKSGKTSLLYSLFQNKNCLKRVYHNVFLFQPTQSTTSLGKNNIFATLPENNKYNELTYDNLDEVMQKIKNEDTKYNNCIIFDDMTAFLKNNDTMKLFKELIFNRRHIRTSIFFLVQTWYSVPKEIRRLFSNLFIFKTSKEELSNIFDELIELPKELIPTISKIVYDEPYQYLFLNTDSQRIFKGFDEIILST
jgi:hypothetical protein